jgi:hypothetical protein
MATGDASDITLRLQRWLPSRWFPQGAGTRVWATISGFASVLAVNFQQVVYASAQSRIATSTDAFLDLASTDYLNNFPRRSNEPDPAYSYRIRREIVRPRNTRAAIIEALQDLTGNTPTVFRPSNPTDTGGYGIACGYGAAGGYGSYTLPFQALVKIQRGTAPGYGAPSAFSGPVAGYGSPNGGYGVGDATYISSAPAIGAVTDDDIYVAVDSVTPAGHINWVQITGTPAGGFAPPDLFIAGINTLA